MDETVTRKRFCGGLLAGWALLSLHACGGGGGDSPAPVPAPVPAPRPAPGPAANSCGASIASNHGHALALNKSDLDPGAG